MVPAAGGAPGFIFVSVAPGHRYVIRVLIAPKLHHSVFQEYLLDCQVGKEGASNSSPRYVIVFFPPPSFNTTAPRLFLSVSAAKSACDVYIGAESKTTTMIYHTNHTHRKINLNVHQHLSERPFQDFLPFLPFNKFQIPPRLFAQLSLQASPNEAHTERMDDIR